jgi:putative inorganic carbon (HCO3(-)) transporter
MHIRDILIVLVVFGALPFIVARPYVGVLVWSWLGYMNPHRLAWGFASDLPLALVVAIATLFAVIFSKEPKRIPVTGLTIVWVCLIAWMGITTVFAIYPAEAWIQYEKVLKIQLMTFATILLMGSQERVRMLIWVIVISLGYYGVKGGVFTIIHGGDYHVWGPPGSFIEGNNELALALLMTLPLMHYLRMTSVNKWIRHGLLVAMILCAFSIVGSQSRGALVGGFAMALFLWLKSSRKVVTGAVLLVLLPLLIVFMPAQWHERMQTIETYETDASAMGRVDTWRMALRLANDKPMGGGFELWTSDTFDRYSPEKNTVHDAHSIYFKVLAEHGWIGLSLFLVIGFSAWRTGTSIIRQTRDHPDLEWLSNLARMIQVSLAAYASGGLFLGLSYFDLYWHLVALLVLGRELVRRHEMDAVGHPTSTASHTPQYANNPASR